MESLTRAEIRGLRASYNLADAHPRQSPGSRVKNAVVDRLAQFFHEARCAPPVDLERAATKAFHRLGGQHPPADPAGSLLCYSASMATEVVANWIRAREYRVALFHPTFDVIPSILRRHRVEVTAIDIAHLPAELPAAALSRESIDVLFMVLPNNPTGHIVSAADLKNIAETCKSHGQTIVIDACFRLLDPRCWYDYYEILSESGVSYLVIEDTGKIWPTLDLKVSFLNVSADAMSSVRNIHDDFILGVSPFVLRLLLAYFDLSDDDALDHIIELVAANRSRLRGTLREHGIGEAPHRESKISVELVRTTLGEDSETLAERLAGFGVSLLSGRAFYWNDPEHGRSYLRIALARDREYFAEAIRRAVSVIRGVPEEIK